MDIEIKTELSLNEVVKSLDELEVLNSWDNFLSFISLLSNMEDTTKENGGLYTVD